MDKSDVAAEDILHHANQAQGTRIADTVINTIGILPGSKNSLIAEYCEMLRNIALRSADTIHVFLYADLTLPQGAENFQAQGV